MWNDRQRGYIQMRAGPPTTLKHSVGECIQRGTFIGPFVPRYDVTGQHCRISGRHFQEQTGKGLVRGIAPHLECYYITGLDSAAGPQPRSALADRHLFPCYPATFVAEKLRTRLARLDARSSVTCKESAVGICTCSPGRNFHCTPYPTGPIEPVTSRLEAF